MILSHIFNGSLGVFVKNNTFETIDMTVVLHIRCDIAFPSCLIRVRDLPLSALYGTAHCKLP